ncbi:hypothetical protein G3R49_19005 [Shewanella sp. WXL01]|uniref:hypothetical protein n=1 Tax=Shewanella sp. WXL01 TaxID=2709721 RepID=UPI001438584C|nr:hypothetical protein [Shewanella sp. WXL01]NKF52650.1 hypothetical protein [Shewanella sp. WXL01]
MWWRVIIVTLAYLLIGAHFLRYGEVEIAALSAAMPLFIAFRHRLSNLIMQLGLIASSVLVWGVSTFEFINMRMAMDTPWQRLALIMATVIIFTLFAAYCCSGFQKRRRELHLYR